MSQYLPTNEQEAKEYASRYKTVYGLIAFTVALFAARLWYLQIIHGAELRTFSEQNSIKETKIVAPRGIVMDREGKKLVDNLPGYEAMVSPQYVIDLEATSRALGTALHLPAPQIMAAIQKSRRMNGPFRAVRVKENLSREEILNIELLKLDFQGIDIKEAVVRSYPLKQNGAQLFGYVGEISKRQLPVLNDRLPANATKFQQGDIIGKSGLEDVLDGWLRGRDGISVMQVDARGREATAETPNLLGALREIQDAVPGHNVILTIDKDVQEAAFNAFTGASLIGGAVAMKTNGEVLAYVSAPSFDPNEFSTGISADLWTKLINDPNKPLRNKVIQDHNAPGSTFKPLVALSALQEKVVTPSTVVSCPPALRFGNRLYHDSVKGGHGNVVITQAIEQSANIFFYKMGIALGIDRMFKYCDALGIGRKTGIDLNGEVAGLMPNEKWKKETVGEEWQPGENLSNAIGQGMVLTTPIQMAVAYNAIGTEGLVYKPFVVKKILTNDNKVVLENTPQLLRDLSNPNSPVHIDKKNFATVKEGLRLVVNGTRGTAKTSKLSFVEMAGKTGTSQVRSFSADQMYIECTKRPLAQRPNAWFIGYAPADKPEIVFGVMAEHGCHGSSAAPVAREMVRAYVAKYHPEWLLRANETKLAKRLASEGRPKPVAPPREGATSAGSRGAAPNDEGDDE